jgi:hypothetical protein
LPEVLTPDEEKRLIEAVVQLGLVPPFTLDASRDRYRSLARIFHPDAGKFADIDRFKALGEAMRVVEQHAAFLSAVSLSWGRGGGARVADQARKLIDDLAAAEQKAARLDHDLTKERANNDFLAKQVAARPKTPAWMWGTLFGLAFLLVAGGAILLFSRSETVAELGEIPDLQIEDQELNWSDATTTFSAVLSGGRIKISPKDTKVRFSEGKAQLLTTGTVVFDAELRSRPQIEHARTEIQTSFPITINPAALLDPFQTRPDGKPETAWAILRDAQTTVGVKVSTECGDLQVTIPATAVALSAGAIQTKRWPIADPLPRKANPTDDLNLWAPEHIPRATSAPQ